MFGITRDQVLKFLARVLGPPRVIYDRAGNSPYLSRYYFLSGPRMPDGTAPFNEYGNPKKGAIWPDTKFIGLYLHRFHRGDDDEELHNHPWSWAVSFILWGGYREERRAWMGRHGSRDMWDVETRWVRPGHVNFIFHDTYHRVDLLQDEAWSLFLTGPRIAPWSFWNRLTNVTTPWREFITQKRDGAAFMREERAALQRATLRALAGLDAPSTRFRATSNMLCMQCGHDSHAHGGQSKVYNFGLAAASGPCTALMGHCSCIQYVQQIVLDDHQDERPPSFVDERGGKAS